MIVVTGGGGFIGSRVVARLGEDNVPAAVIEDFTRAEKWANLRVDNLYDLVDWQDAFVWLDANADAVSAVVHMGAISSTTVTDLDLIRRKNVRFTLELWAWCAQHGKPLVYASSAATYGAGEHGFLDTLSLDDLRKLKPLNMYGWSKQVADLRILRDAANGAPTPPHWYGLKFFNVYGPNEAHKGSMRSVALKLYEQLHGSGYLTLFRSHHPDYEDGKQLRDFVYVDDVADVIVWLLRGGAPSGLYNVGTGKAEPFLAIAEALLRETGKDVPVTYVDMPANIRDQYQYYTEADIKKLRQAGYNGGFRDVAAGVASYVKALQSGS
ncbi:ADP-L-glycero-D-manno-heptose-6-epimerase [Variibacter gotjawalensis]|uniref:ADP-L-glycero-D-manno-heptose-6-epimerase n=1 Tax=Variibacter gotjawalensis TaxID=1333996 RepID=A0A0S3PTM8_9BRAD|nr:ADP-glyceromanno-heptose 6-epimerase [Variibacter gotjawalensis]NIK49566.1 ADP-L-glycero-D-manno-heptose 6-epimerase [Variibacter gotjawalensis]RZS45577.1 ADP-glyceromanno-heptose 6-epimerase precursor [Variibacter gotjawalensis]BAT59250.1 ADP-L-glycero-D-manno-heptose-6-epimerase [Variibacter gotjawalensis]